jgi:hypothetical protein
MRQSRQAAKPAEILKPRCYWALALAVFSFCTMLWMLYAWFLNFIYEYYHLSMTKSSLTATAYIQISCVAGVLSGGLLGDWLAERIGYGRFRGRGPRRLRPLGIFESGSRIAGNCQVMAAAFGFFAGHSSPMISQPHTT